MVKYKYMPVSVFAVSVSFSAVQLQILLRLHSCHILLVSFLLLSFSFCCSISDIVPLTQLFENFQFQFLPFRFHFCCSISVPNLLAQLFYIFQFQFLAYWCSCFHSCGSASYTALLRHRFKSFRFSLYCSASVFDVHNVQDSLPDFALPFQTRKYFLSPPSVPVTQQLSTVAEKNTAWMMPQPLWHYPFN